MWKEEARDDLPCKDERGSSSIRQTLEHFERQCLETSERLSGVYMSFSKGTDANHPEVNQPG